MLLIRLEPEQAVQGMVGGEGSSSVELTQNTQQQICMFWSLLQDVLLHPVAPQDDTEMRIPHDLTPVFFQGKLHACTSILLGSASLISWTQDCFV